MNCFIGYHFKMFLNIISQIGFVARSQFCKQLESCNYKKVPDLRFPKTNLSCILWVKPPQIKTSTYSPNTPFHTACFPAVLHLAVSYTDPVRGTIFCFMFVLCVSCASWAFVRVYGACIWVSCLVFVCVCACACVRACVCVCLFCGLVTMYHSF